MCSEGSFARDVSCTNAAASILPVLRVASELYNSPRRTRQQAKRSNHFSSSLIDAAISAPIRGSLTEAMLTRPWSRVCELNRLTCRLSRTPQLLPAQQTDIY